MVKCRKVVSSHCILHQASSNKQINRHQAMELTQLSSHNCGIVRPCYVIDQLVLQFGWSIKAVFHLGSFQGRNIRIGNTHLNHPCWRNSDPSPFCLCRHGMKELHRHYIHGENLSPFWKLKLASSLILGDEFLLFGFGCTAPWL